jgi:uncharacterized protein YcfJ
MRRKVVAVPLVAAVLVTGCATVPTGPSVTVLPGRNKAFEQFQMDDAACRQWAGQQTGASPSQASTHSVATGAAVGTLIGAAAGAAIGAAAGSPGTGAAVGAGAGLLGGTATGASQAGPVYGSLQRRYDASYMQCMYAKGHQIPVRAGTRPSYASQSAAPPPPPPPPPAAVPPNVPPPPPGPPPPPPPGVTR